MKLTLINEDNTTQEEIDDIIITDKAIAIKDDGIIQLITRLQKEDDNEIIYGI